MKKFLVGIFALMYLGSTIGATVQMHFCMGKFANWQLGHKASSACEKCGMKKSSKKVNGCCKDEHQFIKNASDQNAPGANLQVIPSPAIALPVTVFEITDAYLPSLKHETPPSHAPPNFRTVAVYIRNCLFLI
ncbi:MAG: hypothetical protein ABIN94_02010 [Ferruginibacter sp.]